MRIFVTGGSGFLGKRLVRRLLANGHDVCCLVRRGSDTPSFRSAVGGGDGRGSAPGHLDVVQGNLQDVTRLADEIGACDAIVHGAAAMNGGTAVLFLNNVVATRQLLAVAPALRAKRFVLVSSLGVYGTAGLRRGGVLDESCPLDPMPHLRDPYSYSKIAQEKVAWEAHRAGTVSLVVVRPGVIYGPGKGCLSARIGLRVGKLMVRMGGGQRVPYTYVDNCADAIALAVTAPGIEGEAFNVVDDRLPQARQVLRAYRRDVERLRVLPVPGRAIGALSMLCERYHERTKGQLPAVLTRYKSDVQWKPLRYSNEKAKARLGWLPRVGADEGIRLSCDWSRRQLEDRRKAATTVAAGGSGTGI